MALVHSGKTPPFFVDPIRPNERKWYFGSWSRQLADTETINSSSWSVPAGFTIISEMVDISCQDDSNNGVIVDKCNGLLIDSTLSSGEHYVSNTVTTSDGETLTIGFFIRARDFTTV